MSYASDINSNVNNVNIAQVYAFMYALDPSIDVKGPGGANNVSIVGPTNTIKIKNTAAGRYTYNSNDLIAVAYANDYSTADIAKAFNSLSNASTNSKLIDYVLDNIDYGFTSKDNISTAKTKLKENIDNLPTTVDAVKRAANNATPAAQQLYSSLVPSFKNDSNFAIIPTLDDGGEIYGYAIQYTDPTTGKPVSTTTDSLGIKSPTGGNGKFSTNDLNNLANSTNNPVGAAAYANANGTTAAAQAAEQRAIESKQGDYASKLINAINNGGLTNVSPTYAKGSDVQNIFNQSVDQNAYYNDTDNTLYNKLRNAGYINQLPNAVNTELKDEYNPAKYKDWLAASQTLNEAQNTDTDLALNQQRTAAIKAIQDDPELYNAVISQLRSDTVAGTTAGQTAANVYNKAKEANANYNETANSLRDALISGENAAATLARSNNYSNLRGASTGAYQSGITKAESEENIFGYNAANVAAGLNLFSQASEAEAVSIVSELSNLGALSESTADYLIGKLTSKNEQDALQKADILATVAGLTNQIQNLDSADSSAALESAISNLSNRANASTAAAGSVTAPTVRASKTITDPLQQQILNGKYNNLLNADTFNKYAKAPTESDYVNQYKDYNLQQLLDKNLVANQYTDYAEQANKESDRVFNTAQRAYISAIAAGDTKTTEQLTKLAQTASTSKQGLYSATALANQQTQQRNNSASAMNMYYDTERQKEANKAALAQAKLDAYADQNTYWGTSGQSSNGGGISDVYANRLGTNNNILNAYTNLTGANSSNISQVNSANRSLQTNYQNIAANLANAANESNKRVQSNLQGTQGSKLTTLAALQELQNKAKSKK